MTDPQRPSDDRDAHLARRRRQLWRVVGVAMAAPVLVAAAAGLVGLPGAVGAIGFLLTTALVFVAVAVFALVTSMTDDLADRGVGRHRPLAAGGLMLAAFLLIGMVMGVAGA